MGEEGLLAHVLHGDRFGNLTLDAAPEQLAQIATGLGSAVTVQHGERVHLARRAAAFADVRTGELLIYEDAQGMVALAVNRGSAEELLGARRDDQLVVRPA
jgi:S-adenosylmethionine hydrolase